MVHGKDLILSINGTPIAAAKSCDLSIETDFLEVCSPTDGSWRDYIPTIHQWSASADTLCSTMENFDILRQVQLNKEIVTLTFYNEQMDIFYKGNAYIQSLKTSGQVRGLVSMSIGFQTTGALQSASKQSWSRGVWDFVSMKYLLWATSGRSYLYIKTPTTGQVFYYAPVTLTVRTRYHFDGEVAVLNGGQELVREIFSSGLDDDDATYLLNGNIILYVKPNEQGDIVLPPGEYIFLSTSNQTTGWKLAQF